MREKAGCFIAKLAGEHTVIDDLSISKVIDNYLEFGKEIAGYSYDMGRTHQVMKDHPDSTLFHGTSKEQFLNTLFPPKEQVK